jgi:hypothetical protein
MALDPFQAQPAPQNAGQHIPAIKYMLPRVRTVDSSVVNVNDANFEKQPI